MLQQVEQPVKRGRGRPPKHRPATPPTPITSETVTKFGLNDWPKFGNWLLTRLETEKPWYSRAGWLAQIRQMTAMNEWYMIKTEHAVFIGAICKDPGDPRPRMQEFLCWCMDKEHVKECVDLYRFARTHSREMNAKSVYFGFASDMTAAEVKAAVNGDYAAIVFVDLTK